MLGAISELFTVEMGELIIVTAGVGIIDMDKELSSMDVALNSGVVLILTDDIVGVLDTFCVTVEV